MPYVYAGLWGPDAFTDSYGNTLVGATLTVYRAGTLTAATLYTDQSKATVSLNPVSPDPYGNFKFWTDPGLYDLNLNYQGQVAQTIPAVLVSVNPLEAAGVTVPDGSITGGPAAIGVKLAQTTITHDNVATANKDGLVGVPSLRTIGTGALQAMAGNDTRVIAASIATPRPYQFAVSTYGAVGDNTTDDTAAINSCVSAAQTYAVANGGYAEIVFDAKTYLLSAATTQSATFKGNAQIPLPLVATTARKVTLVFRGTRDQGALYHWQQTARQNSGTVLRSTLAGTNDATWGEACVLGGPAVQGTQGYGPGTSLFSNMNVVIDGVSILVPNNPSICGFDFRGVAEANVINASCMIDTSGLIGSLTMCSQGWQFGLAMPATNNNDNCDVGRWSCEGMNYGLIASEHTFVASMRSIYCIAGLVCAGWQTSSIPHGLYVAYASIEACQTGVQFNYLTANPTKVVIAMMDWESGAPGGTFHIVNDPSNNGVGTIGIVNGSMDVNGGQFLKVTLLDKPQGTVAAPAVPASTVVYKNTLGRDAAVNITGGTLTAVLVDAVATGFTATGCTVIVPSNKTISITYTVAPSWNWILF